MTREKEMYEICHKSILYYEITIGEIFAVLLTDVAVAGAREVGKATDFCRHIFGDVAEAVTFGGDNGDGVGVVGVGGFGLQGGNGLAQVVGYVFAVGDSCNGKFEIVTYALILGPYADVIAFVFYAEILEALDLWFFDAD